MRYDTRFDKMIAQEGKRKQKPFRSSLQLAKTLVSLFLFFSKMTVF